MSVEQNKAVIRRFLDEVQSGHDLDVAHELMSSEMIDHFYDAQGLPHPPNAVEAFKQFYRGLLKSFPDLHVKVHSMVAEGDMVCTYKTFHGTHRGTFKGVPSTGKKISVEVMDIFRVSDGKMTEHWLVADWGALMRQIGANRVDVTTEQD